MQGPPLSTAQPTGNFGPEPQPADPNSGRSALAQLLMNIFNQGQPFNPMGGPQGAGGAGSGMFPAPPGSGVSGMFPSPPGGAPTDMSVAGPWGAGIDTAPTGAAPGIPQNAPTPTPRPNPNAKRLNRGQY